MVCDYRFLSICSCVDSRTELEIGTSRLYRHRRVSYGFFPCTLAWIIFRDGSESTGSYGRHSLCLSYLTSEGVAVVVSPTHQQLLQMFDDNMNNVTLQVHEKIYLWRHYVLFTWQWWLGIALTVLPWFLWYLVSRKRADMDRLLYVSYIVMVIALCLDIIGDQIGLWHYRYNVIPHVPTFVPFDLTLVPVSVLITIQTFQNLNPVIKGVAYALASSYIGEPFFHAIDVYNLIHWRYMYSVPIQICIYLAADTIYKKRYKFGLSR